MPREDPIGHQDYVDFKQVQGVDFVTIQFFKVDDLFSFLAIHQVVMSKFGPLPKTLHFPLLTIREAPHFQVIFPLKSSHISLRTPL